MRVLVNSLSIGSLSGQHVVLGFLARLIPWTRDEHEFVLLHNERTQLPASVLGPNVTTVPVSHRLRNWLVRSVWEATSLRSMIRQQGIDLVLNPSGALLPNVPVPQAILCQNPWCFVSRAQQGSKDQFKARLQRGGYRRAYQHAGMMFYISDHLRSLYAAASPGVVPAPSEISYVGVNDETWTAANSLAGKVDRVPGLIVSVSAMARWKGVETLVEALQLLRQQGVAARLRLVGPWPDSEYEQQIHQQVTVLGLQDCVEILGQVSKADLYRHCAEASVFSLLSHCESFGIPAVEAQAFGTPGVVTTGCAMPEVCGDGAIVVPPGDAIAAADALGEILQSPKEWSRRSLAALKNVQRFHWDMTSQTLLRMFDLGDSATRSRSFRSPPQAASA